MPTAYQLWLEDQKKKQQDAAQGKVNFREASTASRPQYTLPAYSSRDSSSDNHTYQWEKDLLTGMKGKGIGKSYEDKFQALAKSLGLSDGRANDFRNFLNFQEDSQQTMKLNKDGTPSASQNLRAGQGAQLQGNLIDSILKGMQQRGTASVQAADQKQQEFEANQQKLQSQLPKERTGLLGFLDSTLGRAGQTASSLFGQDFVNAQNENYANLATDKLKKDPTDSRSLQQIQILNNLTRAPKNNTEKAADFVGNTTAAMAPYVMGGAPGIAEGVLSKVGLNSIKNPLVKDLVRGLGTGFVGGNERQVLQAIGNGQPPSDSEYAKGVLTETALGGAGDAALGAFARNINLKGQLDQLMAGTKSVPYSEGAYQKALQDAFAPKGDVSNVLADVPKATPSAFVPKYPNMNTKSPENIQQIQQDLQHLHTQRQAYEDAHVQEVMQPFLDTAKKQADAQLQWENSVKNAKSEIERIKGTYGKIQVPKGAREDYKIPPQFRASLKDKHSDDIYTFATQEGFSSVDDAVKYLQSLEKDSKVKLKDIMPDGTPLTNDHFKALEDLARKDFASTDGGKAIDNLITNLLNIHSDVTKSRTFVKPDYTPMKPLSQAMDELTSKYKALDKTKANEKAFIKERDALYQEYAKKGREAKPSLDNLGPQPELNKALQSLGQDAKPTETPVNQDIVNNSQEVSKPGGRLKLNLQQFNTDTQPQLFATGENVVSKSPIDSIKNPFMRAANKVYEHIAGPTREASVAEEQILKDKIKRLKEDGNAPKKVAQLEKQLKQVQRSGSDYSKALQNQQAAAAQSQVFSKRHVQSLQDALGSTKTKDMSDALHYLVAKNVDWVRTKGGKPEYELGKEWDQGRINQLLNLEHDPVRGPKLQEFAKAFKQWSQERLDIAYKYNMINKNAYDALSKNPYYVPLSRDLSAGKDNITRGLTSRTTGNVASADAYFIHSLDQGSAEALVKNPLETMIMGDYSLFKNAAKADTAQQVYRLAKLNKGAAVNDRFVQEVPKSKRKDPNVIEVPTPKGTKYVQVQDDLMNIMREAEMPQDLDALGKATSLIASLKTRSFEFQFTNVIRDLKDGYLKGQVSANPLKYGAAIWKAALERNASAKEVGAFFEHASKDGMGGMNQEKLIQEFARRYTGGKVHTVSLKNPKTWGNVFPIMENALDKVTKPIKTIGQFSDELPRTVEVNETKRLFMKKYGDQINRVQSRLDQVNQQLNDAQGIQDPFDPRLKGIDNLKMQKVKLENMLNQFDKNLRREQTYRGRDLMNFQRVGRGKLTKRIKQYVMYANTTTQAKDKLIRSVIERPGQTMAKMALLTSPFIVSQYTHYQNSSESDKAIADNLPFWLKEFNYTYVQDGNLYTVPKNQELAILLNPIEAAIIGDNQGVNDALRAAVKETVPLQLGNFTQGLVPNTDGSMTALKNSTVPGFGFSPILDVKANEKLGLNSNPISIQDYFHNKDPKANKYTMDIFKKMFGDKPRADYAQYLATYLPGDYGKYGVNIADFLNDPSNQSKLDAVIQNLNPLQDRIYGKSDVGGHQVFKNVPQKSKVTKK